MLNGLGVYNEMTDERMDGQIAVSNNTLTCLQKHTSQQVSLYI